MCLETKLSSFSKIVFTSRHVKPSYVCIRSDNLIIKIIWTLGLLTASALCCYFVIYALAEYFSYEVTSTTRIYYETTSLFPRVTFCNVNPYTTKRSYQLANETTYHEVFNFNTTQRDTFSQSLDDTSFRECSFNTETCDGFFHPSLRQIMVRVARSMLASTRRVTKWH